MGAIVDATPDDAPAICAIYNADNATRTLSVARPLEMVTAQLEAAIRSRHPDPPMRSWRFVQTPDNRLGRLLSVTEDETTARVRFFGELPEDVDPDDVTAKSDDPDNKHYEMEVPAAAGGVQALAARVLRGSRRVVYGRGDTPPLWTRLLASGRGSCHKISF